MAQYRFSEQAEKDLQCIIDFTLNKWGAKQSNVYLNGLEELAQNLADFPGLGTNMTGLIEGLISFPYLSHVLYYTQQPHGITIVRVLHKRMKPKRHLSEL